MSRLRSRTGSNLIEFALVLPLLLILVFGIIDFSIALYDKAVVTNASREAARAGIVFRPTRLTTEEIQEVAVQYCGNHLITFGGTTAPSVTVLGAQGASGSPLSVTVAYPYTFAVISRLVPGVTDPTLANTAVMRME